MMVATSMNTMPVNSVGKIHQLNEFFFNLLTIATATPSFRESFRKAFPPIKIHLLERPYITGNGTTECMSGLVYLESTESIHAKVNSLFSRYNTMHDKVVQRQLCIVKHLTYHHQKTESSCFVPLVHVILVHGMNIRALFGDTQLPQNYRSRFQTRREGFVKDLTLPGKSAFWPFLRRLANILHLLRPISFKRSAFESQGIKQKCTPST